MINNVSQLSCQPKYEKEYEFSVYLQPIWRTEYVERRYNQMAGKKSSNQYAFEILQLFQFLCQYYSFQSIKPIYFIWSFDEAMHSSFLAFNRPKQIKMYQKQFSSSLQCKEGCNKCIKCIIISVAPINRSFSVGLIQYFLKEVLKQSMSFIFYINNGFATLASIEHFQGYHQSLSSFYTQTDDLNQISTYPQTWAQSEIYTKCDTVIQPLGQGIKENIPKHIIKQKSESQKPKKRMEKTLEKQILSAKKNSQSNIINQFFSFFSSRQKSDRVVEKCAILLGKSPQQVQKIVAIFYAVVRFINTKRGRKYVNVSMFLKFFTPENFSQYLGQMKTKIDSLDYLNVQQLCEIFRRCIKYFIKDTSINGILTSKRISVISKEEHLKKRRRLLNTIMGS